MAKITKRSLNDKGEAIRVEVKHLVELLNALSDLGHDIDDPFKVAKDDREDEVSSFPELTKKLTELAEKYTELAPQIHSLDKSVDALFALTGHTSPVPPSAVPPTLSPQTPGAQPSGDKETGNFVSFLSKVGEAVLNTQRDLDRQSQAYIVEAAKSEFAVPLAFRIPKLSGKMLFALDFKDSKGVNLIFHSESETAIRRNQQEIEFDIVAVPAPPGADDAAHRCAGINLTFDPAARSELLKANQTAEPPNVLPAEAAANPSRILILHSLDRKGASGYLVIYPGTGDKASAVGVWLLADGVLEVVYPFTTTNSKFEARLKEFALGIAEAQRALLDPANE